MKITSLATSFARSQKAQGRSPHTVKLYRDCIHRLAVYLDDDSTRLTRRELTDFYAIRSETVAPATVWTDWKVHRVFLGWMVDEEEIPSHPMAKMKPPKQPIVPVPVITDTEIARLLAACAGRDRRSTRDRALITFSLESGSRRGELALLKVSEIDLDRQIVLLTGKGKTRIVPIGPRAATALDRWLRLRGDAPGSLFGLTASGISQAFKDRAREAGLPDLHIHMTRHTFAHRWMAMNGSETDLLTLGGWSPGSRGMLDRYGASARVERAVTAFRRMYGG